MLSRPALSFGAALTLAAPAALAITVDDYSVVRGYEFSIMEMYRDAGDPRLPSVHGTIARQHASILDRQRLERVLSRVKALVVDEAARRGLALDECRPLPQLDVYQVPEWLLADRSRFSHGVPPEIVLWGVYDPLVSQPGRAAIVVIDHGRADYVEPMMAHELVHYWVDRLCWDHGMGLADEEALADAIQVAYSERYHGRAIK